MRSARTLAPDESGRRDVRAGSEHWPDAGLSDRANGRGLSLVSPFILGILVEAPWRQRRLMLTNCECAGVYMAHVGKLLFKEKEESMSWFGGNKPGPAVGLAAFFAALVLAASCPAKAQTACPATPPNMTIKIYNDSTDKWLFAELEVGLPNPDVWIQAICMVPNSQTPSHPYPTTITNRIYINPTTGIAPGQSVFVTLPLYTQLVATVNPMANNQYAEWWQGQNMQMFVSATSTPPEEFTEYYNGTALGHTNQASLTSLASNPTWPTCTGTAPCTLAFKTDPNGTLPKFGPSQLIEATLGARQAQPVVNDSPPNALDTANVDFDVSYVNVGYAPAAMGPVGNDQVGYVGSPMLFGSATTPATFQGALAKFLKDFPGWPRFVFPYANGTSAPIPKLPSSLELVSYFSGANPPTTIEPTQVTGMPKSWPNSYWPPIQTLRTDYITYTKECHHSPNSATNPTFCDALLDVNALINANYAQYLALIANKTCTGPAVPETSTAIISHVYSWGPWTESLTPGNGCSPTANLLENTPGYWKCLVTPPQGQPCPAAKIDYSEYARVKSEFDQLQYGLLPQQLYVFDPWVEFIHSPKYLNIPGAYAYSVDDAVGNIQSEGTGYIIDFQSLEHLENQYPAAPPINISVGYNPQDPNRFRSYRVCVNDTAHDKPLSSLNPAFVINARDPENCPVYLIDGGYNKSAPQTYTFTVTKPPPFTEFTTAQVSAGVPRWSNSSNASLNTTSIIDCSGNTATAPFAQSSKSWCCNLTASTGAWAYTKPDPTNVHQGLVHTAVTIPALAQSTTTDKACSLGH